MFQIGDKVRLKGDHLDSHWIVVGVYREMNEIGILFFDQNGTITQLVNPSQISLVDQNAELKQAIREVLLSEEFLKAFAKAWMKTPILHESELNLGETK